MSFFVLKSVNADNPSLLVVTLYERGLSPNDTTTMYIKTHQSVDGFWRVTPKSEVTVVSIENGQKQTTYNLFEELTTELAEYVPQPFCVGCIA